MKDTTVKGPGTILRDVVQGLSEGRYVPGQRLSEPDLMARYGVSRSSVREALGQLAANGLVEQIPHKGAQIRLLTRREARDVLLVAQRLLMLVAVQAAEAVRDGADPEPLRAAITGQDGGDLGTLHRRAAYYRALFDLAGNAELNRLMPMVQTQIIRAQLRSLRPDDRTARASIVQTVSRGNVTFAEIEAERYVQALLDLLPQAPDGVFATDGPG